MNIGVIGLGKLGLPLALTYASQHEVVVAFDHNPAVCESVRLRKPLIDEPLVNEMINTASVQIMQPHKMAEYADIIFVVVPTPSQDDGTFTDEFIRTVIMRLPAKTRSNTPTVIAVVSTVSPGAFSGENNLNDLARSFGHRLAYVPTMIALGSVVHNLIYPDVQIVGVDPTDDQTIRTVVSAVTSIIETKPAPVVVTDFESAALAKLASNVFVTLKIGFANALAQICDLVGGNVNDVTTILGMNKRIGPHSLTAGAGYGGPCFPRDAAAFAAIEQDGAAGRLGLMTQALNDYHLYYVVEQVTGCGCKTYCVLGRNYKEGSPYSIDSFGDRLDQLLEQTMVEAQQHEADLIVVAQPLRDLDLRPIIKPGAHVYDMWRTHGYLAKRDDITYVQLGNGSEA